MGYFFAPSRKAQIDAHRRGFLGIRLGFGVLGRGLRECVTISEYSLSMFFGGLQTFLKLPNG